MPCSKITYNQHTLEGERVAVLTLQAMAKNLLRILKREKSTVTREIYDVVRNNHLNHIIGCFAKYDNHIISKRLVCLFKYFNTFKKSVKMFFKRNCTCRNIFIEDTVCYKCVSNIEMQEYLKGAIPITI